MIIKTIGVAAGLVLGGLSGVSPASAALVIGTWDFNTADADASTGTLLTNDGNGQINPLGDSRLEFGFTAGSSDSGPHNSALRLGVPAGATAGSEVGAEFGLSTLGYTGIQVTFDFDHPVPSAQPFRFEYSGNDGMSWTSLSLLDADGDGFWSKAQKVDLTGETEAGNNFNLRFRFIGELETDVLADGFLLELDQVQVTGVPSAVPEPTAVAMSLGLAALALGRWFRRR